MMLKVRVVPRAKKEKIEEFQQGLKVYVTAPALEGKANKRLLEVLATHLKVKKSSLKIIKGQTSRDKIIEIE
ncbi:MAG: DUF167 domain-containing protein [Candidatus Omnitrophica bacterium]|nr:DUF167 domain-containing protein [Candidatus Omnitrophota bacterium]